MSDYCSQSKTVRSWTTLYSITHYSFEKKLLNIRALMVIVCPNTVELQWLEYLWNHENMFETGIVQANEGYHSARPASIIVCLFLFSIR